MATPVFNSRTFLDQHVDQTLRFYEAQGFDSQGGFFHYFRDDGSVYEASHRHLVSATRFVFNWSMAHRWTGRAPYLAWAQHALQHLKLFQRSDGLFAWTLRAQRIEDATVMAYGQAFVLLAMSHAHRVGLASAAEVAEAFDRMGDAFYSAADRAYADEITSDGALLDYRGQNANMHMCEACLSAFEATGERRYLTRAQELIQRFAFELATLGDGLIWEHFGRDWAPDWSYNKDNPGNIFKPWGYQTGHQTEWAKLLMMAHHHTGDATYVARAAELQHAAYRHGWDGAHGGLIYGFAPDRMPCDTDKYFWVQAESLASAWRLWRATGDETFFHQYQTAWAWSWRHLVDHQHGAWFRIVGADGRKLEDTKSPAGKTDYHTMGACWDVMDVGGLSA